MGLKKNIQDLSDRTFETPIKIWSDKGGGRFNEHWAVGISGQNFVCVRRLTHKDECPVKFDWITDITYISLHDSTDIRPEILDIPREVTYKGHTYIRKDIVDYDERLMKDGIYELSRTSNDDDCGSELG